MKRNIFLKSLSIAGAIAAATMFASCNIFNPTGNAGSDESANSYQEEAYKEYRKGHYSAALEYFDKAIEDDSTNSEAYLGAAKAALADHQINAFTVLSEVKSYEDHIPFFGLKAGDLKRNYEGIFQALQYIHELSRRDSVTRWTDEKLSNRKVRYESIAAGHSILEVAIRFLSTGKQFNELGVDINTIKGTLQLALSEDFLQNLSKVTSYNETIKTFVSELDSVLIDLVPQLLGTAINSDAILEGNKESNAAITAILQGGTEDITQKMNLLYINDNIDNDGDGCVDEEIYDGLDNDGDGLIDEDLRNTNYNGFDHNMNGIPDDDEETVYFYSDPTVGNGYFLFAADPSFSIDYSNAKRLMLDPLNPSYDLKWRKRNIGGCWVNYNEEMFEQWFVGR